MDKNTSFGLTWAAGAAALSALALCAGAAIAQQADTGVLEEITVTAQKRTENLQQVPIAISAFSAEALQQKAITSVDQLSNLSPNVNLDAGTPFSGSDTVLSAYIRGIGQDDFAFNLDPGVGVYVDGVYLARSVGANTTMLDVDRVEILKGPQGTLFGRNSIGGAISIVTRDPGNEFKVKGEVTGGSFNRLDTKISMDVPFTGARQAVGARVGRDQYHRQALRGVGTEPGWSRGGRRQLQRAASVVCHRQIQLRARQVSLGGARHIIE
jgi:outer membrane receptor protein involved in Fe transport